MKTQDYLVTLKPHQARKVFHVRAGILDVKSVRKYWYDDTSCRLCGHVEEDAEHVVNNCVKIDRTDTVDIFSDNINEMEKIAERCLNFATLVKELENVSGGTEN